MLRSIVGFACVIAVCNALKSSPKFHILSAPRNTRFDVSAGSIPIEQVSGVAASALGLSPPSTFTWKGLFASSPFNKPRATATVIVEGSTGPLAEDVPSYELTGVVDNINSLKILANGGGFQYAASLASIVAGVFGADSMTVSVSASSQAALIFGTTDVQSTMGCEHVVSSADDVTFVDAAIKCPALDISATIDWTLFPGVQYNTKLRQATVNGVVFTGKDLELFAELNAMLATAGALKSMGSSAVLTFTVTKFVEIASRHGDLSDIAVAARGVVLRATKILTVLLKESFEDDIVVFGVSLGKELRRNRAGVVRRDEEDQDADEIDYYDDYDLLGNGTNGTNTTDPRIPLAAYAENPAYFSVDYCSRYMCYCFAPFTEYLSSGNLSSVNNRTFASKSVGDETRAGCIKNNETGDFVCVWDQSICNCSDPDFFSYLNAGGLPAWKSYVYPRSAMQANYTNASISERFDISRQGSRAQKTNAQCLVCQYGFVLMGGRCYLESTETAAMQFGVWTSLTATAAVIGIWYVLHGITDGSRWSFLGDVPEIADAKKTG